VSQSTPVVDVRPVRDDDLLVVARLHVAAFPESVLGQLGTEAVRRNYVWQLHGPHDVTALVAQLDGQPVGFLFGGVFRGSTIGFVKSQKFFLAGRVLRHPKVLLGRLGWDRIGLGLRLLTSRWSTPAPEVPEAVPRSSFGVLAIAVDPDAQGHGVGRALMSAAEESARSRGFTGLHLSVHPSNVGAVEFYERLGWERQPEPSGVWQGRMSYSLTGGAPGPDGARSPSSSVDDR